MPLHIAQPLRSREEALEAAGLLPTLDSIAVTTQKTLESLGTVQKPAPIVTYVYNNTVYTPKIIK